MAPHSGAPQAQCNLSKDGYGELAEAVTAACTKGEERELAGYSISTTRSTSADSSEGVSVVRIAAIMETVCKRKSVEALQLHSNTQSHWSRGSTVRFLPRGAAVCAPGECTHTYNGTGFFY